MITSDVGRPLSDLTHRLTAVDELANDARAVLLTQQRRERELDGTDGRRYLVSTLPYRSLAGEHDGVVLTFVDITELKRAEAALRDADRRKDEFLATLSHELRNPLTPLRVALDLQKLAPDDVERVARTQRIMDRQLNQLIKLVDDLLDLSRITQGKIDLDVRPVELAPIVEDALETTRSLFDKAGHNLAVTLPPAAITLHADTTRLAQILVNLLSNAAKYTPDGGQIALDVVADPDAGVTRFTVRDNGVGLAADSLAEVFELFMQCRDDAGRARGGLGIGLHLVRRLAELHGGRARAHSDGVGQGSAFVVEIPFDGGMK